MQPSSFVFLKFYFEIFACLIFSGCTNITSETNASKIFPDKNYWPLPHPFDSLLENLPERKNWEGDSGKILLGKLLFFDRRLSLNNTKSCATCHDPKFAFSDSYRRSTGALGQPVQRNSPSLANLLLMPALTYANPNLIRPYQQVNNPLYHTNPIELGLNGREQTLLATLNADTAYQSVLKKANLMQNSLALDTTLLKLALEQYVYSLTSSNAPYDRYWYEGKKNALDEAAKRGMAMFFSDSLHCSSCHKGFNFAALTTADYFNTGLYNIDGKGSYPSSDQGLYELTKNPNDMGKFRVPSLRNLAFTAPYWHDGSTQTLNEVIDIYANGGRHILKGPNTGNGQKNPLKDPRIKGFTINAEQKMDLLQFLLSLSDSSFVQQNSTY